MPPRDPRLRPALERALPADDVDGGYFRSAHEPCEVMFGDGQWHHAELQAWRKDRRGRWVADLMWYADGSAWTESYLYEAVRLRPVPDC